MGVRRLDRRRRLYLAPFQWRWALQKAGLTYAEAEQAVWTVSATGDKQRGAGAVSHILDALIGGRMFGGLYNLPLIGSLQDSIYNLIAKNRHRLPGTTPAIRRAEGWQPQR